MNRSSPSLAPGDRRTIADVAAFDQAASSTHERDLVAVAAHHRQMVYAVLSHVVDKLGAETFAVEVADGVEEQARQLATERATQLAEAGELRDGLSKESIVSGALAELTGMGPLDSLMDESGVSSIAMPRFDQLTVTRQGRLTPVVPTFSCEWSLNLALSRLAAAHDATLPVDDDIVDLRLDDGTWLSLVRGAAAPTGTLAVIRRPRRVAYTLEKLVRRGTVSRNMATFLEQCVSARLNMLIVGPLDEGSSMLLSGLCAVDGEERVIALSDADDVVSHVEAATRLNIEGAGRDSTRLLQIASRIPDARLAATLAGREMAAATLEAIGDGITGVLAAIRATDLRRALGRLPADLTVARPGMSVEAAREWVRSSFDVLIEVARLRDGRIRVLRIAEFSGMGPSGLETRDIFTFVIERVATGGAIEGSFTPGDRPQVLEQMRALGIDVEDSVFSRPPSG
jgi:pilus assembly protein CpaF